MRSAMVTRGYWRQPAATAAAIDRAGWYRTGDAGWLDADGDLFIHDRVKDMIVSGGENVYPAEVENAIDGHPDVSEVAVIGVPDERWGEAVKAIVVLKPDAERDPALDHRLGARADRRVQGAEVGGFRRDACRATRPARCCGGCCASLTGWGRSGG